MKTFPLLFTFLLFSFPLYPQEKNKAPLDIESLIERLFALPEEDLDYESLYEVLLDLYQNPLDLNRCTEEELLATYLLSPQQARAVLAYRNMQGDFLSLYELQSLPEWDSATVHTLLPFLRLENQGDRSKPFFERLREEENAFFLSRHRRSWPLRKGYLSLSDSSPNSPYLGDPNDFLFRFRIQHARDFSLGLTLEKDPGESLAWDPKTSRYGFTFVSFHHTRYGIGKWKTISLGDFQASFGQGLVLGAGYSLGKGAETVATVRRSSMGLLPYTAGMEFGFFRGLGVMRQLGHWQSTLFFSSLRRDGRIQSSGDSLSQESEQLSSLSQTGLHRSLAELSLKNNLRETSLGTNLHYSSPSGTWTLGGNALYTHFSLPWIRKASLYNRFEFSGQDNLVGSLYVNYSWKNLLFFGESAQSSSKGRGTVLGAVASLSKTVDFSLLWRKYDRHFHSLYATGFSEGTRPINETGIYMGLQVKLLSQLKLNAYVDAFSFPWLKFRVYAPSQGQEWLVRLNYQPNKQLLTFVQFRQEQKYRNLPDTGTATSPYQLGQTKKSNLTLSVEMEVQPKVTLRTRLLWNQFSLERKPSEGWMLLQEVAYGANKWKLTGRVALFDAATYDNRIYTYEQNAVGTFAIPAFAGRGSRKYLLGRYQIHPQLMAYLRIAQTLYSDKTKISSGLQEIVGSKQTDTVFVLRYSFH